MGRGVYSSDFNETGETFIVDGPLGGDQAGYDHFNVDVLETVARVARELDMVVARGYAQFRSGTASFDGEFFSLAEQGMVEIGWRSWESDFIIGVGPSREGGAMRDIEGEARDIVEEFGRAPEAVKKTYDVLVDHVARYLRLGLMEDGFECRFKAGSYSMGSYDKPADIAAEKAAVKAAIADGTAWLSTPAHEAVMNATAGERAELAEALKKINDDWGRDEDDAPVATEIPYYDPAGDRIMTFSPHQKGEGPWSSCQVPDSLTALVKGLPVLDCGLAPLPRTPETEAWFMERMGLDAHRRATQHRPRLFITADEYATAVGEDCVMTDGDEEFTLAEYARPTPGLR